MNSLLHFLQVLLAIVAPATLALAVIRGDYAKGGNRGAPHMAVLGIVVWAGCLLLGGHLLGTFGLLKPVPVAAWNLAILVVGIVLLRSVSGVTVVSAESTGGALRRLPFAVVAGGFAAMVYRSFAFVPSGTDSISYHLPEVCRWLVHGDFRLFPAMRGTYIGHYGYGWDVSFAMMAIPLMRDTLMALPNAFAWLLFVASIAAAGREVSGNRDAADNAAALAGMAPMAIALGFTAMADVALAAFSLAGFYLGVIAIRQGRPLYWALWMLAMGMLATSKTSGVGYCIALVLAAGIQIAAEYQKGMFRRILSPPAIASILAMAVPALFLACFWLARNYYYTGDIMGPIDAVRSRLTTLLYGWRGVPVREFPSFARHFGMRWGVYALVVPLGLAIGLLCRNKPSLPRLLPVLWLTGCTLALYTVTPFSASSWKLKVTSGLWIAVNTRFALTFAGAVAILLAVLTANMKWNWKWVSIAVAALAVPHLFLAIAISGLKYRGFPHMVYVLLPVMGIFAVGAAVTLAIARGRVSLPATTRVVCWIGIVLSIGIYALKPMRRWAQSAMAGGTLTYLDERFPKDEKLVYLSGSSPYYFIGPGFDIETISQRNPNRYDFFIEANTEEGVDLAAWMHERGISYFGIGPLPDANVDSKMVEEGLAAGKWEPVWGKDMKTEAMVFKLIER